MVLKRLEFNTKKPVEAWCVLYADLCLYWSPYIPPYVLEQNKEQKTFVGYIFKHFSKLRGASSRHNSIVHSSKPKKKKQLPVRGNPPPVTQLCSRVDHNSLLLETTKDSRVP